MKKVTNGLLKRIHIHCRGKIRYNHEAFLDPVIQEINP